MAAPSTRNIVPLLPTEVAARVPRTSGVDSGNAYLAKAWQPPGWWRSHFRRYGVPKPDPAAL